MALPLKLNTRLRAITVSEGTWERRWISPSVMPSDRYSASSSVVRLAKGITASERAPGPRGHRRHDATPAATARAAAPPMRIARRRVRPDGASARPG